MPEEIFKNFPEPEPESPKEISPETEILLTPKPKRSLKKIIFSLIILVALASVAGASFYFYPKIVKPDPISLLPKETSFYLKIKIDSQDPQVKNLKELLNRFPYYEKISQKLGEEFQKWKEETPALKNLDFTISNELILAIISPIDENTQEMPIVLIFPNPDLKKAEKLAKDIEKAIEESKEWKIEKETYKGREIFKAVPIPKEKPKTPYYYLPPEPKERPSMTFTDGHFFFALKPENIKKIIDVADDRKITNIFKKGKAESITSNLAYQKIQKYLPKDYLTLFYGQFDYSKILKSAEIEKTAQNELFSPIFDSLKAALNLPFLKKKEIKEPEKVAFASVITAEKDGLKSESYSLDLREDAFLPSQFSLENSLAKFIPAKIGNREMAFYLEGRNLKNSIEEVEKEMEKQLKPEEKEELEKIFDSLKENLGLDLKKDILTLFEKNYAIFVASESSGKETPILALVSEIDDESKAKENLLKIKIPKPEESFDFLGLEGSRKRAKDARIMADMSQLRTMAEMIYDDDGNYRNVKCTYNKSTYGDVKEICQDIKEQVGFEPVIYSTTDKYCAYSKLNTPGRYYCVDSSFTAISTYINPGQTGYCTGKTFVCPKTLGTPPLEGITLPEMVSFLKETIDGFEIYSLPIFDNFGLNFSIKDKKLIFAFSKDILVEILKNLSNQKLKDSKIFSEQFKEIPKEVSEISFTYPYGFLGAIKNLTKSYINFISAIMGETPSESEKMEMEKYTLAIEELLDKGIAPYLKLLKSSSSYSYSPEKGLTVAKGRISIGQLSEKEKRETEAFWTNFRLWLEEKFEPIYPTY